MIRKIIKIEEKLCNGCGLCAAACHEGAISMVEGKAKLMREDYCDGLGDCLPSCPAGAISFEEREAPAYDHEAVLANQKKQTGGLMQWPVQIKLVPFTAPYFEAADLLIAADCTAFAYGKFHQDFIKNHIVLIGCPKLDEGDYSEKLTEILKRNSIKSVKIVRMEVPCCRGIERAAKNAIQNSGKLIPCQVITISVEGNIG